MDTSLRADTSVLEVLPSKAKEPKASKVAAHDETQFTTGLPVGVSPLFPAAFATLGITMLAGGGTK